MRDITIPAVGYAMTEALLLRWIKQPGDAVAIGEAVAEIETDKAAADLEAPAEGVLGRHRFEAGALVPVGVALAVVLEHGEAEADGPAADVPGDTLTPVEPPGGTNDQAPADRPRHLVSPRQRAAALATASTDGAQSADGVQPAVPAPDTTDDGQRAFADTLEDDTILDPEPAA